MGPECFQLVKPTATGRRLALDRGALEPQVPNRYPPGEDVVSAARDFEAEDDDAQGSGVSAPYRGELSLGVRPVKARLSGEFVIVNAAAAAEPLRALIEAELARRGVAVVANPKAAEGIAMVARHTHGHEFEGPVTVGRARPPTVVLDLSVGRSGSQCALVASVYRIADRTTVTGNATEFSCGSRPQLSQLRHFVQDVLE